MKKLLVVLLVLCLAPLAGAQLSLVVNGLEAGAEITMAPSDFAWIGVYQDIQMNANTMVILVEGPGSWTGLSEVYIPPALAGVPGWTPYGLIEGIGDAWNGDFGLPGTAQGGPGVFGAVQFHCEGPGDVLIVLTDENLEPVDSLVIHQIPEPATIALLCLGGLLLRKK
ncbi:MAG: PEP-CTERM sorting domain-containing protein [Phycisphaerae bacterium]|jgi:hypothetical protein